MKNDNDDVLPVLEAVIEYALALLPHDPEEAIKVLRLALSDDGPEGPDVTGEEMAKAHEESAGEVCDEQV